MTKLISALIAGVAAFIAVAALVARFLLTSENLADYQVFGGVTVVLTAAGAAVWLAYLTVWSLRHKAEAVATIS